MSGPPNAHIGNRHRLAKAMNISSNTALALLIIGVLMLAPSSAGLQERIFENKIPAHIPIKIKIRKEKEESFKDLKNEKWLREFELEVTNTGDKPIYFLLIHLGTNVKFDGGREISYSVMYGRPELGDILTKATSDDVPIKPGETIYLSVNVSGAQLWETLVREQRFPESNKFTAEFQQLSFGDGTGYFVSELYPPPGRRKPQ